MRGTDVRMLLQLSFFFLNNPGQSHSRGTCRISAFLSEKQITFDTAVSGIISEIINGHLVA